MKNLAATVALLHVFIASSIAQEKGPTATITPVCDHFYLHTTATPDQAGGIPAHGLIAETPHGVILVDNGWDTTTARQVLQLVATRLKKPVSLCIVSHWHADRVGGTALFQAQHIRTISTPLTASLAAKAGHAAPEGILPNDTSFTVDGVKLTCYYPGPGHTVDNILVWFPAGKVLFAGCFIKSVEATDIGYIADGDLQQWPASIKRMIRRFPHPAYIIPGHQQWNDLNATAHTLQLIKAQQDQEQTQDQQEQQQEQQQQQQRQQQYHAGRGH